MERLLPSPRPCSALSFTLAVGGLPVPQPYRGAQHCSGPCLPAHPSCCCLVPGAVAESQAQLLTPGSLSRPRHFAGLSCFTYALAVSLLPQPAASHCTWLPPTPRHPTFPSHSSVSQMDLEYPREAQFGTQPHAWLGSQVQQRANSPPTPKY